MTAPQAGRAHSFHAGGWIWLVGHEEDGLSSTLRADSVILIEPLWDRDRDVCTGCLVHLISGKAFRTAAMPHEIETAMQDATGPA